MTPLNSLTHRATLERRIRRLLSSPAYWGDKGPESEAKASRLFHRLCNRLPQTPKPPLSVWQARAREKAEQQRMFREG